MVCVPTPADAGLKVVPETPGPEKVPPEGFPVIEIGGLLIQVAFGKLPIDAGCAVGVISSERSNTPSCVLPLASTTI